MLEIVIGKLFVYLHTCKGFSFSSEFEDVLKVIKWPFTSSNSTVHQTPASPESIQRLCTLTQYLLQITLPGDHICLFNCL